MIQSIRENCQDAMDEIIVVTFLLGRKLCLENFVPLLHDIQEHGTNVEFLQCEPRLEMQEIRVCLADERKDPAGILIRLNRQFVCIYDGFLPELLELVDGG
jgi:hypothetical protein